jgi:hypothetical protein
MTDEKSIFSLNDEWELHELVEALSAEFDRFTDTVCLKSYARGITFGLTSADMEIRVFSRFDAKKGKMLFRTAQAGEEGASLLKLTIPSLIRDQVRTHEDGFEQGPDTRPLEAIGINETDKISLERLGIFTVDQLKKMTVNDSMRTIVSTKTGISKNVLAQSFSIPSIWQVTSKDGILEIRGENLEQTPGKSVLLNGNPMEIISSAPNLIRIKDPQDTTKGTITIVEPDWISEPAVFDRTAPRKRVPLGNISGIGSAEVKKLESANVKTTEQLLASKDPIGKLRDILGISDSAARDIFENIREKITR